MAHIIFEEKFMVYKKFYINKMEEFKKLRTYFLSIFG